MEKQINIKTSKSLVKAIDTIIKESIKTQLYQNGVEEKRKQSQMLGEDDDDLIDDESGSSDENKSAASGDPERDKLKKGDISSDDIVTKLNTIRGGKSFKDQAVAGRLDAYIKDLTKAEKIALFAFLKGLSQIVTGEVEQDDILDPSEPPSDVEMEKTGGRKEVKIKPNVIKAPKKEKSEKKPAEKEDTSGPVPITPKK